MLFYLIDVSVDTNKVLAINGSKKNYKKEIKTFLQTNNIDFSSHIQPIEYTFCCSFTQNIQSFTSTVETITQIYIH